MRRKPGALLPIEVALLRAGVALFHRGEPEFHGYAIARAVAEGTESRRLTAHGTLYRALDRLETAGLLESTLEDADAAAAEMRPRRRLYRVTAAAETALAAYPQPTAAVPPSLRTGEAPA